MPLIRSAIAIDGYRADDAIVQAREALGRRQARGGHYAGFDANRQTSSYLGVALDFLELNEWSQFYADRAFDPFLGTTYIDEAVGGGVSPFVGAGVLLSPEERALAGSTSLASQLQGYALDPLAIASQTSRTTLERTGVPRSRGRRQRHLRKEQYRLAGRLFRAGHRLCASALQFLGSRADILRPDFPRDNDQSDITSGSFYLGFHPTLDGSHGAVRRYDDARQRVSGPDVCADAVRQQPHGKFKSRRGVEPYAWRAERHPGLRHRQEQRKRATGSISTLPASGPMTIRPTAASPAASAK